MIYIKILAVQSYSATNLGGINYLTISSSDCDQRPASQSQMGPTEALTSQSGGLIGV